MGKGNQDFGEITVIDAGARYGIHPFWKEYFNIGSIQYFAFEPDVVEAERLSQKYAEQNLRYQVHPCALMDYTGSIELHITQHRGGCSHYKVSDDSFTKNSYLEDLSIIEKTVDVPCISLDKFCSENKINPDYLKIDTEGSEFSILNGALDQLANSLVAVYAEIHFNTHHVGAAQFPSIMNLLMEQGYYLVNLSYDGRGIARNKYTSKNKYGIINACDSLWLKRLFELNEEGVLSDEIIDKGLIQALVCMTHNATDLGIEILLNLIKRQGNLDPWMETPILGQLDLLVQRLFRELRQEPAHDEDDLARTYQKIFRRRLKRGHEYFQSEKI